MLVPLLTPNIGLVNLNWTTEQPAIRLPCLADAVSQVPSGGLRYAQVPMQLHAADTLQAGIQEEYRQCPLVQGDVGALHHRVRLNTKVLAAIAATGGLWLARRPLLDVQGATPRASYPVGPASFYEHHLSRFLVTELFDRLYQCDSLSKTLAWHLHYPLACMGNIIQETRRDCQVCYPISKDQYVNENVNMTTSNGPSLEPVPFLDSRVVVAYLDCLARVLIANKIDIKHLLALVQREYEAEAADLHWPEDYRDFLSDIHATLVRLVDHHLT